MTKRVLLDTGPLGKATHPRPEREFLAWFKRLLASKMQVIIPEIADYEVRRELIRARLKDGQGSKGLQRLDDLKSLLTYLPIDTRAMLMAARFWAQARNLGKPTAHPQALDGDAILAGQAKVAGATVATENVGHLSLFVQAKSWREIEPDDVQRD